MTINVGAEFEEEEKKNKFPHVPITKHERNESGIKKK